MIVGLGDRIGNGVDTPVSQLGKNSGAGLIAIMEIEGVGWRPFYEEMVQPAPPLLIGFAEHVVGPLVALANFGADQHAVAELQSRKVCLDDVKVLVIQLPLKHCKEYGEATGGKLVGMRICLFSQPPKHVYKHLQYFDGSTEQVTRVPADETPEVFSFLLDGFDRKTVDTAHNRR